MRFSKVTALVLTGAIGIAPLTGCESLPGGEKEQGAVIGGVGGAVAGAALGGEDNRLLGALIGGALGAGGGYVIGANMDDKEKEDKEEVRQDATEAVEKAQNDPATAEDARNAETADLNKDGFVTLDEVVAMDDAGLSDDDMIQRLEATKQEFALTAEQEKYLKDKGVNDKVVVAMREMEINEARLANNKQEPEKPDVDMRTDPR
jgi:hypothetical protein